MPRGADAAVAEEDGADDIMAELLEEARTALESAVLLARTKKDPELEANF